MRWRWDQGRLQYFRYENIVKLAAVLESLDGVALGNGPDLLREPLTSATELPFLPVHYRIKLKEWGIEDFGSKKMALDVYEMAKREIVV